MVQFQKNKPQRILAAENFSRMLKCFSPRMEKKTRPPAAPDSSVQGSPKDRQAGAAESGVLRLLAEEAKVSRESIETGRVRVAKVTRTRDHLIDELLTSSSVEVSRVPIGRLIDTMPAIKEEGDLTIVPIVEETVVVERKLMLKEELHIRRVQTTERYQQTLKLRYQTAEVTRTPAQKPTAGGEPVDGPARPNPEDT
ncbi:MAG: YsnF/AvaK domain-containing protein [Bradyrhizobium sp.]|nr:YsnF/AvaK domain-containing protein [Bradyrhizobium sp.]